MRRSQGLFALASPPSALDRAERRRPRVPPLVARLASPKKGRSTPRRLPSRSSRASTVLRNLDCNQRGALAPFFPLLAAVVVRYAPAAVGARSPHAPGGFCAALARLFKALSPPSAKQA